MTGKKFNPKIYQGKARLYQPIVGAQGIARLWIWDHQTRTYRLPKRGKIFDAKRYEPTFGGGKKRVRRYFSTLEEARAWQRYLDATPKVAPRVVKIEGNPRGNKPLPQGDLNSYEDGGPLLSEVFQEFKRKKIVYLSQGTQINYARYIRLYFSNLMQLPIQCINARVIDEWIDGLKATVGHTQQSRQRTSFCHELSVLTTLLKFYEEYYDDPLFRYPVKSRHRLDAFVAKAPPKLKDLTEREFFIFRERLKNGAHGEMMASMATLQFYQALRISEAAGVFFEDFYLNFQEPQKSTIRIQRHVEWPRQRDIKPRVVSGFKNASGGVGSIRELYLYPQSFHALFEVQGKRQRSLVFSPGKGEPFTYRQIQKAYDTAFIKANLPYRGTHVLRHGGCRRVYNLSGGDLALAQQLLGNSDLATTQVYAKRDRSALKEHVQKSWLESSEATLLAANGRK